MSDTTKNTPLPWRRDKYGHIVTDDGQEVVFRSMTTISSGGDERIAEAEANTDLVAIACSSHQALIDALEAIRSIIYEGDMPHWPNLPQVDLASRSYVRLATEIDSITDAALAQAREK